MTKNAAARPTTVLIACGIALVTLLAPAAIAVGREGPGTARLAADAGEPDSCASPRLVTSGSEVSAVINPSTESDYFAIDLKCGDVLRVDLAAGEGYTPYIQVHPPSDPTCLSANHTASLLGTAGDGHPITLLRAAPVTGRYTLRVRVGDINSIIGTLYLGAYTARFSVTPGPCVPPAEPADADTCATATPVKDGDVLHRAINPVGDGDFYAVEMECGDQVVISATSTSATLAPRIDRFARNDSVCASPVNFIGSTLLGGSLQMLVLNRSGAGDGTYRFRIRANNAGGTGTYTLMVSKVDLGFCSADSLEPDDAPASCLPLPEAGERETHTIAPIGDQDWHCASLACGDRLTLGTAQPVAGGTRPATYLAAFDAAGRYVDGDVGSGGLYSRMRFAAPADGDYAFQVRWNPRGSPAFATGYDDVHVLSHTPAPPLHGESDQTTDPSGTLVVARPEADAFVYTAEVGNEPLLDISATGTSLGLGNDSLAVVDLPFPFEFLGTAYEQATVTDNGFVTFEEAFGGTAITAANPCPFPDGDGDPNLVVAPFWDALNPAVPGANVLVETVGSAPTRSFIVQWHQVALSTGGGSHTFQALLHEDGNRVEFRYGNMSGAPGSSGSSATIGIEDETGVRGLVHSCNAAGGAVPGQSITYHPPSGRVPFPSVSTYLAAWDTAAIEDISGTGTKLVLTDNGTASVVLPFPFTFYDQVKTSLWVAANGLLRFVLGPSDLNRTCGLPNASSTTPSDLIAPFWEDWNPAKGGAVYWAVDGAAPDRRFLVLWKEVPHFRAVNDLTPAGIHTFEAILHEGTNAIELRYGPMVGAPESDGNAAVVGIESGDSGRGLALSCFSPGMVSEGARAILTPAALAPTFAWKDPDTGDLLGTDPSYFLPAAGRCDVRLATGASDPESLCALADERLVTVPDIAPPVVEAGTEDLYCVWPPDHRWVTFVHDDFAPVVTDNCSATSWVLSACVADAPDAGSDCVVAPDGQSLRLRAERDGGDKDGRRYAIGVVATDSAGNRGAETFLGNVLVPHDRSRACGGVGRRGRPAGLGD